MAFKEFALSESQTVKIYKRRSSRSLRLSVTSTGQIRITIPLWATYHAGLEFARSKQSWINTHHQAASLLKDGQAIGKAHHLRFEPDNSLQKPTSRVKKSEILVRYSSLISEEDDKVQNIAQKACIRALRTQAEILLPQRLQILAEQYDFIYNSVAVRHLKSRWGSCDHKSHIVLNIFLLQLPWELIDYVLLHELTHTKILRHGPDFWQVLENSLPSAKSYRKAIRDYQPIFQ
jgi:predicted metal-dependent hydrolase